MTDPRPSASAEPDLHVFGSHVYGTYIACERLPAPGETVLGHDHRPYVADDGGKGSNQALAARRLGARVAFTGVIGDDAGRGGIDALADEGIDVSRVTVLPDARTGVSVALVASDGQSMIVTDPGANAHLGRDALDRVRDVIAKAAVTLAQFETPADASIAAIRIAKAAGKRGILTPGPMVPLEDGALDGVDILAPNETEAAALLPHAATADAPAVVREIAARWGVRDVVMTRGAKGVVALWDGAVLRVPGFAVEARNTVGAGDCLVAGFGCALAWGLPIEDGLRFACAAAALSVRHAEAPWSSYERIDAVLGFMRERGENALAARVKDAVSGATAR